LTADYLTAILQRKREEIARLKPRAAQLRSAAGDAPPARPWSQALCLPGKVALIGELKRRAPSMGSLRPEMNPARFAQSYEQAGAAALSVLTDADFDGELTDLAEARAAVTVPALRKDFILDPVQVYESRAAGADAVLLIVRALPDDLLAELLGLTSEVGLGALVEVHDETELDRALASSAEVIGINNRDLRTFDTSLDVTLGLADAVPADRALVAESGITSGRQVSELGMRGVDAVLVGRALVSHADPARLARELASQAKRERS